MSSTIDSRILSMKIDNRSFLTGIAATINSLANLRNAMNFSSANKGMADLQAAGNKFNLGGMESAVSGISAKFVALSTIAITALSNITNRAVNAGLSLAKSFTVAPITQGLQEYETQLNAVQTILANTQAAGTNINDVNKSLSELNTYADKTIYNFSEMTRNIGTFTAAGVDLKTATASIKGIANLAALSGSNSQQASTAMYQLSQAISAGRVSLMDWNSVVNAGMGGTVFQRALAQTAEKMGTLEKGAVKLSGKMKTVTVNGEAFRNSISAGPGKESWLTSDVLTQTLKQFTGDLSAAQLKAQGFSAAQIKSIQAQAKTASEAATQVKTFTQLIDTTKEALGSGWATTWQTIFGNFNEAKKMWTGVSNTISGIVQRSANARNKMLKDWKKEGGRDDLLAGIASGWKALTTLVKPIREAFRDIFPRTTGKQLATITRNFRVFMDSISIGSKTVENLRRTFRGVFAVFDILWQVVKGVLGVFGDLFGTVASGSGGILGFTANLGDFLVALDESIKKGGLLNKFFSGLAAVLSVPIKLIQAFGQFLSDIFTGFNSSGADKVDNALGRVGDRFGWLSKLGEALSKMMEKIGEIFGPLGAKIGAGLAKLTSSIVSGLANGDFSGVFDALNTGLFAVVALAIRKLAKNGLSLKTDLTGGAFGALKDTFGALTGSLKAMQTQIQAKTLFLIAGAVAVLTASVIGLSLIDSKKLTKALAAMSVGFSQLLGAMAILVKISGSAGFVKVPLIAASMLLLSASILSLTLAVALMGQLKWETIGKGLTGIAGVLTVIGAAMHLMPKGLPVAAAGLVLVGIALAEIAGAMVIMSTLSWKDIGKGLTIIAGTMLTLSITLGAMGPSVALVGPGLVAVGVALTLIAGVMKKLGSMSWEEIAKSMVALAGSMTILSAALVVMSAGLPGAAALAIVSPALLSLGVVMKSLAKLSWEDIAQALVALAGALTILSVALLLMDGALPGAAALLIISPALLTLASVLSILGGLSWEDIAKGLIGLAGALTIIGVAGYLLAPVVVPLLILGASMTLIGAGFALAGVGVLAFATAFSIFVGVGAAGIIMIQKLIDQIPVFATKVGEGVVNFIVTIAKSTGKLVSAFTKLLIAMIDSVIAVIPRLKKLLVTLINAGLSAIRSTFPNVVKTGIQMIMNLLDGIDKNISKMVDKGVDIAVKFMNGIAKNADKLAEAGFNMVKSIVKAVVKQAVKSGAELLSEGAKMAGKIIAGMVNGIKNKIGDAVGAVKGAAGGLIKGAGHALGLGGPSREFCKIGRFAGEGLINGLLDTSSSIQKTAEKVGRDTLVKMGAVMSDIDKTIPSTMNLQPTVTPILDLTNLKKGGSEIGKLVPSTASVPANLSYAAAAKLSSDISDTRSQSATESTQEPVVKNFEFKQYNTSPESLSNIEIYRQTKNQLAQLRGVIDD